MYLALLRCCSTTPHYRPCPSLHTSVCLIQAHNSIMKKCKETKIGVNVPQGRAKQWVVFQLKGSKVRRTAAYYMSALGRRMFLGIWLISYVCKYVMCAGPGERFVEWVEFPVQADSSGAHDDACRVRCWTAVQSHPGISLHWLIANIYWLHTVSVNFI